jgi:hypothetical protein
MHVQREEQAHTLKATIRNTHLQTSMLRTRPCRRGWMTGAVAVADGSSGRWTYQLASFVYLATCYAPSGQSSSPGPCWTLVRVCPAPRRTLNRRIEKDDGDVELN